MFLALILGGGAFALIAWLIFNFSVYALPFFVGITSAKLAHDSGAGMIGAGLVGLVAGGLSFGIGQFAFAAAKSVTGRVSVIAVLVAPAAIAGYFSPYGIAQLCTPPPKPGDRSSRLSAAASSQRLRSGVCQHSPHSGMALRARPECGA